MLFFFSSRTTSSPSSSGICRSRMARSGCNRSIASSAAAPSSAAAISSTSSNVASIAARRERAGRSSSAMSTLSRSLMFLLHVVRNGGARAGRQADGRHSRRALVREDQRGIRTEVQPQTLLDVFQTETLPPAMRHLDLARHSTCIPNRELEQLAPVTRLQPRTHEYLAADPAERDAVLQGVLDQRLEEQRW